MHPGLWNPWTWLVTYWLYFAHFFFFTTLAVRTGRTSLWSLYLWGVLFGLYESWITKVIWAGYQGDGNLAMGSLGPYGYSEISMVFLFHPVLSFIIPLAVACVFAPSLRRLFPDLAWFSGKTKGARTVQAYIVLSAVLVMAVNSGGPVHLALNLAFILALLAVTGRLARATLSADDAWPVVVFGRKGFIGLCIYLGLLYGVTYPQLRTDALPSAPVQLLTFVFYAVAILGLWRHRRREPAPASSVAVEDRERRLAVKLLATIFIVALLLSPLGKMRPFIIVALAPLMIWTPLGVGLTAIALVYGTRKSLAGRPQTDLHRE